MKQSQVRFFFNAAIRFPYSTLQLSKSSSSTKLKHSSGTEPLDQFRFQYLLYRELTVFTFYVKLLCTVKLLTANILPKCILENTRCIELYEYVNLANSDIGQHGIQIFIKLPVLKCCERLICTGETVLELKTFFELGCLHSIRFLRILITQYNQTYRTIKYHNFYTLQRYVLKHLHNFIIYNFFT